MKLYTHEEVNDLLDQLPTARDVNLFYKEDSEMKEFASNKGIIVTRDNKEKAIAAPSKKYEVVEHVAAFKPIIDGLVESGEKNLQFTHGSTIRKAWVNVIVGEAEDGVKFGFSMMNSYDGSTAIRYGFSGFHQRKVVEVVGYRLSCQNGMKVKVPLDEADVISEEESTKVTEYLKDCLSVSHRGDAMSKIQQTKEVVKGFMMLKDPLSKVIGLAQKQQIKIEDIKNVIERYAGARMTDRIKDHYDKSDGSTLWDLYNTLTWLSTHAVDLAESTRGSLMNKASMLLYEELFIRPKLEVEVR